MMDRRPHLARRGEMGGFAAEAHALEPGPSGGAADVRERPGRGGQQAGELRAAGKAEVEPGGQRVRVIAQDAEEIDDLAIDIVEDF